MAGPIAEAFVSIQPDFGSFDSELRRGLSQAERIAERAGENIEDSFDEAARQSADAFDRFSTGTFDDAVRGSARAGEQIEDNFREAARTSERALGGINVKRIAGGLAAAFAGVQIGSFFADATLDAQRLNSAIANTEQIIKATSGVAGITADAIRSSAQELSTLTGVAAVEIQEASNVLLTFRNIGEESFGRAQQAGLDLAAVLGTDLNSASVQLGKALNDPITGITALNRAGVTFTEAQKEQIRTLQESGDVVGAQNIILSELEAQVGGTAAASADSTAKIAAAFTALKESLGGPIIAVIDQITPTILGLLDTLGPVAEQLGGVLGGAIEALAPTIETLLGALEPVFAVLGDLIPVLAPIAALFGQVIVGAVQALAAALRPLLQALAPVAEAITAALGEALQRALPLIIQVATALGQTLARTVTVLFAAIEPLIPVLLEAFVTVFEAAAPILPLVAQLVASLAASLADALAPILIELVPLVAEFVAALIERLSPFLPVLADLLLALVEALIPLLPPLLELVEAILPLLLELVDTLLIPALTLFAEIIETVLVPTIEFLTNSILLPLIEVVTELVDWLTGALSPAIESTGGFFAGLGEVFSFVWQNILSPLWSFFSAQFTPAIAAVGLAVDALKALWDLAWGAMSTVWNSTIKPIYDWLSGTFTGVFDTIGGAVNTLKGTFDTAWNGIKGVINSILGGINSIIRGWNGLQFSTPRIDNPIPGLPDIPSATFGVPQLPTIPLLASGGVVTGPTLAVLGDNRSGKEAVVPLERAGEFGFGGAAALNVETMVVQDATDADLVAQRTVMAITARRLSA